MTIFTFLILLRFDGSCPSITPTPISYHKQSQWRGTETAAWLHLKRAPICRYKIEKNGNSTTDMSFLQKIKNNTNFVVSISFLGGHTAHTVSVWKYIEAWLADLYLLAGRYKASVEFVIFFPPGVIVCAHYVLRASVISRIFLRLAYKPNKHENVSFLVGLQSNHHMLCHFPANRSPCASAPLPVIYSINPCKSLNITSRSYFMKS